MSKKILITAFEKFHHFTVNPSEIVLELVRQKVKGQTNIEFKTVEVSFSFVDHFIQNLITPYDLIIHLGVAANQDKIKFENVAQNLVSGRDVKGQELSNQVIKSNKSAIVSTFPPEIVKRIISQFESQALLSDDAGTYLCNYIYYKSLYKFGHRSSVLFIHIADFINNVEAVDSETQAAIVGRLIHEFQSLPFT